MLRCLLVEDEPDSLNALKQEIILLKNPAIEVAGEAISMLSAIEAINTLQPNVVLMDIELGDGTGFDVLERVAYKNFAVIFITAYNEYAIKAFKVNAIDYLLKPFPTKELVQAFEKILTNSKLGTKNSIDELIVKFNHQTNKKISFSTSEGVSVYAVNDIIRCESDNNYSCIYIVNMPVAVAEDKINETDRRHLATAERMLVNALTTHFPGIDIIATTVHMSPTKLKTLFRKVYGNSLLQYYQEKQMILALSLLKTEKLTIKEVSNNLGYDNPSNFTLAFKKVHNFLPSEIV